MPASPATGCTLTAWVTGTVSSTKIAEALRVVCVGVTRAPRLLGLAIPATGSRAACVALSRQRRLALGGPSPGLTGGERSRMQKRSGRHARKLPGRERQSFGLAEHRPETGG